MAGDEGEAARVPGVELRCPNCGAPTALRAFQTTRTLACEHCGSVIDTSGERWQLVQQVEGAYNTFPRYKLGTRGKVDGVTWEVIGWCERSVHAYGKRYAWEEHLLYNPYEGFRYLNHQDGHFVWITPLPGAPSLGPNRAAYEGQTYKHFSTAAQAKVDQVLGEFPWQMKRGDTVRATDYVDPPFMLSSEEDGDERTWSRGRYMPREEVVAAFGKFTREPQRLQGVYPCQPNPFSTLLRWSGTVLAATFGLWLLLSMLYLGRCENRVAWRGTVGPAGASRELVLDARKGASNLELDGRADVDNSWTFLECMLVGPLDVAEQARFAGLEISYYHGVSGGESWSEGSRSSSTMLPMVPNGRYLLQVSMDPGSLYKGPVDLEVRQDAPAYRYVCCSFFLLFIVPLIVVIRRQSFEGTRWSESDHAG